MIPQSVIDAIDAENDTKEIAENRAKSLANEIVLRALKDLGEGETEVFRYWLIERLRPVLGLIAE